MTRQRSNGLLSFVCCLALAASASSQAVIQETPAGPESGSNSDGRILDQVFRSFATGNNAAALDAQASMPPVFVPPDLGPAPSPDALVDQTLGCLNGTVGGADINNGTVRIGVRCRADQNLYVPSATCPNYPYVGLRFIPTCARSTEPGCTCEGWGIAEATWNGASVVCSGVFGQANSAVGGDQNLSLVSFQSSSDEAVSTVRVGAPPVYEVTHHFRPSLLTNNVYEAIVTIRNISAVARPTIYRRVMDWDIDPTPFNEFVTIVVNGTTIAPGVTLVRTNTNGFNAGNPCSFSSYQVGPPQAANIVDAGPNDHGAMFDLDLGLMAPGEVKTFIQFWGGAATEGQALGAMALVGAQTYSLGQPNVPGGPTVGSPNTFFLGMAGSETCGDGVLDVGEECDDGNNSPGDGCDAVCRLEVVLNNPPTADAGGPYVAECGRPTAIALDGTGSFDPDPGDSITYAWTTDCPGGVFDDASSATPVLMLDGPPPCPVTCTASLTVRDVAGLSDSDDGGITVDDRTPPSVVAATAITCLWSPNHKFVDVGLTATSTDACDPTPVLSVMGISSSEPTATQLGAGGPVHCPDAIVDGLSVQLRAERSGLEEGRVYGITVRATDRCGNSADTLVEVRVPHDQNPKSPGQTNGNDPDGPCEATGVGIVDATVCN